MKLNALGLLSEHKLEPMLRFADQELQMQLQLFRDEIKEAKDWQKELKKCAI